MTSSMKVRFVIAAVAMALLMMVGTGVGTQATSAQNSKAGGQRWSEQRQGLIDLTRLLYKQYQRSNITLEQLQSIVASARGISDELLAAFAKQYKQHRDYETLRQALVDTKSGTVTAQVEPDCDCACQTDLYWTGCMVGGGDLGWCNFASDHWWCVCIGGTWNAGNGLCY